MRWGTPTWGAARPMPGAAYMVSIMSLTSRSSSESKRVTGSAGACSGRSPYLRIGRSIRALRPFCLFLPGSQALADAGGPGVHGPRQLVDRVAAEFFHQRIRERKGDHRFTDDSGGGNGADIAALDG